MTTVAHTTSTPTAAPVYQVHHGDWLWYIAQRFLGDPERYTDIAALNPHLITATTGIHGPDHIEAGWRLTLPADAHDRGPTTHAAGTLTAPPPAPHAPPASTAPPQTTLPTAPAPSLAPSTPPSTSASPTPSPVATHSPGATAAPAHSAAPTNTRPAQPHPATPNPATAHHDTSTTGLFDTACDAFPGGRWGVA